MKKRMVAAQSFRYGTRALVAGDVFDARAGEARALEAIGRARFYPVRERTQVKAPDHPINTPDIDALRDQARSVGLKVDARWKAETLAAKIEEAGAAS